MAKIIGYPRFRAFKDDNSPAAGWKLYSYAPGTSTPKALYTDAGGLTAHPNPVILNSLGEAAIWMATGGYKFILTDENDVAQWTSDDISSDDAATLLGKTWAAPAAIGSTTPAAGTFTTLVGNTSITSPSIVGSGSNPTLVLAALNAYISVGQSPPATGLLRLGTGSSIAGKDTQGNSGVFLTVIDNPAVSGIRAAIGGPAGALVYGLALATKAMVNADTTPSVLGANLMLEANTGATVVTDFDDAFTGQIITILFTTANTTIQHNANIKLAGGVNFVSTANDTLTLVHDGAKWVEVCRSVNG